MDNRINLEEYLTSRKRRSVVVDSLIPYIFFFYGFFEMSRLTLLCVVLALCAVAQAKLSDDAHFHVDKVNEVRKGTEKLLNLFD